MSQGLSEAPGPEFEKDNPIDDVRAAMAQLDKSSADAGDAPDGEAVLDEATRRDRNEKGQFARQAREAAAGKDADTEIKATTDSTEVKGNVGQTAISPPTSWSPEAKAEFTKLAPAVQTAVLKREREVSDGFAQKSEEMRALKEVEGVIAPRRSYFQKYGFKTDAQVVNHLLSFSDAYERDPVSVIQHLAQSIGLNLPQLTNQGQGNQPQIVQPQGPDINQVVEDHLGMAFARREIEEARANTKEYPHFDQLRPVMAELLMGGRAKDFGDAYRKALRLDDGLFEQEVERTAREKAAKANTTQNIRVNKAKSATRASISGAPHGSPSPRASSKTVSNPHDDAVLDVRAAMEQLGAG